MKDEKMGKVIKEQEKYSDILSYFILHNSSFPKKLGREDSNLRMPPPKGGALPLGDAPIGKYEV
jgi:hypothetical protein